MKKTIISTGLLLFLVAFISVSAQVKTNLNNTDKITVKGKFNKAYKTEVDFEMPARNLKDLLEKEINDYASTNDDKPFRLATPVPVDIDIATLANWSTDGEFDYGKFSIRLKGALSSSINFDKFILPANSEMYIYNENGNMITGPITEKENNPNYIWGSWVYQGEYLNIVLQIPKSEVGQTMLRISQVGFGFMKIGGGFFGNPGASATCNINVLCAQGNGWQNERNSVALIVSSENEICTGTLIMNTCGTNRPYLLTANHCLNGNVQNWVFQFQTWSSTCIPNGTFREDLQFNGCQLRANNAATDFALLELNQTPATNSGITYSGWNRNANAATRTTSLHHPMGDVMKVCNDFAPPVPVSWITGPANYWRAAFDEGIVQFGSSGAALFDQNNRIVGQLFGNQVNSCFGATDNNVCWCTTQIPSVGEYGRFDVSWTGGGTDATQLSNWLDPTGTGALTTNTSNISNLPPPVNSGLYSISGSRTICNSVIYSITPALPPNTSVVWSVNNSSFVVAQNTPATNQGTVTVQGNA